jgi:predicted PurR-regulated permease PerM
LVMNKVTGLPPIVVILSVILGSAILGPLGAILAVPVMSTIIALKKKV